MLNYFFPDLNIWLINGTACSNVLFCQDKGNKGIVQIRI